MARNGSGTMSVINTYVSGNVITASAQNQNAADFAAELTNSVAADGQTSMTGPLKLANGSAAAPAFTFASDTDTGGYRIGANNYGIAVGGTKIVDVAASGVTITGTLVATSITSAISGFDLHGATQLTAPAIDDEFFIYDLSATSNKRIALSDHFKVINLLTADSSPDSAADYVVTYDNSAAAAKKVLLSSLPSSLPRGYIDGLILSNNGGDAVNDIDIAAGVCRDSTNTVDIILSSALTKQLDANWASGSAAGMRNSGAGITNTTYHLWAVRTAASSAGDIYAHTSTTAATVLAALQAETGGASYAYARLIGSIVRAGNTILAFTQVGDSFLLSTPVLDVNTANPGTSAVTATLASMPTGLKMWAIINSFYSSSSGNIYISSLDQVDLAASTTVAPLATYVIPGTVFGTGPAWIRTNTSAQIRYRVTADNAVRIATLGWIHPRGRDQ